MVVEVWGADTREYEHEEGLPFYVERICERKMQHFRRNALSTPLPSPIEPRIKPLSPKVTTCCSPLYCLLGSRIFVFLFSKYVLIGVLLKCMIESCLLSNDELLTLDIDGVMTV